MNRAIRKLLVTAAMCAAPVFFTNALAVTPQGTSFTYQGRLTDGGAPANGAFDIEVRLFDAAVGGLQVGGTVTLSDQSVQNGVFSTLLDFGAQFNGSARWLELRVRAGASVGAYTTITPRTLLDSTPYAQALRLPVAETGAGSVSLLDFTNTNTSGSVMNLTSVGASGNDPGIFFFQPVLKADTNDGNGIFALTSKTGAYAIYAVQSGTGGRAIVGINSSSDGEVARLDLNDATNTSNALEVQTTGTGRSGWFNSTNAAATLPTVYAKNVATGDSIPNSSQENGIAIKGESTGGFGIGVMGKGVEAGVFGYSGTTGGAGVWGKTGGGGGDVSSGVRGDGNGAGTSGVAAFNNLGTAIYGQSSGANNAGFFSGNVTVTGNLQVNGAKNFKIDHPLDPANKFLIHAAVESSEMKNIYDGVVTLGADGGATVSLPNYFGALNVDYRYQLTCIGGQAMVYVAEEISQNQFKIAGGKPGMKVSWQVTGVRNDAAAISRPMQNEVNKVGYEIGRYMNPEAFGKPASQRVNPMDEPKASKTLN